MSDGLDLGVLYTDHAPLTAGTPVASLWSYQSARREGRPPVTVTRAGDREYWLHRSDPLLNTMLPGTYVSVVVNLGDRWVTGRSLPATALVPPISLFGPSTRPQLLRVGRHVRAVGAVLPAILAGNLFGVPAPNLVDQVVPLDDLWRRDDVERLLDSVTDRPLRDGLAALRDELVRRLAPSAHDSSVERAAVRLITATGGRVSIDGMARRAGISRQRLARRFHQAAGVPPKLFARIVRFHGTVHSLLSTDVSDWAGVAPELGFYDQAHMVNEFRSFAGAPPTAFFQPHGDTVDPARIQLRGRPSEWPRRA
jgi:AraC-like DNA-binding protein